MKIRVCKEYKKSKYDNICANCNSNKSYCNYTRTKNNLTTILIVWSLLVLSLTSCTTGKLTTNQKQNLIKIDKEMNELWNEYEFKIDSLWIKRDSIIRHKQELKECCKRTAQEVYEYEGLTIENK
tara:strand:+ start:404 stop:778 length:375 start_codon:yes stop_codon:yes gene_type:complete